ncbi:DUF4862 family protein [Cellulomonas sp. KRMCY2]|uniref:DUF4862 family protein n=1 Tax=Cellulomonas sp. KRMCY2 TaxID=1304865 RepID=UPI00045E80BC|nr:DUF4862 family protein [Cellulomonas sp. KRMCY2]
MTIPALPTPGQPPAPSPLLGAYAMAPADPTAAEAFYAGVAGLDVGGLELPLGPAGSANLEPAWFTRNVQPDWDLLVTCIPAVMGRLGTDAAYGLSSSDADGRRHALDDVARARDLAVRLADEHGRRRVVAIQVHSAPGPGLASLDAFTRSLEEILGWDLAGAEALVEHCDARVPGQPAAKGFWSLADEIAAIGRVGHAGLSINWGRSAIEGRSAATALEHVTTAAGAGLLRAVVLSGATDAATPWGAPWGDAHIPPRGADPALAASHASLLGAAEIAATLAAAGPEPLVAVKVSVRPADADVATRLAVARAALDLVATARAAG